MASSSAVWGLDIGRCALKALRCRMDGDNVIADGFDYIEYPKLLTQPEADAPQLVKEALEQFLSRNSLKGDKVAISVSGESGLARYFKPPPVDVKKIADIVKYEAKQQIPFALEDVIWDYQRLPGGQEVDGFALDTEIGLFAMKREQVAKALTPYDIADIDVDIIQLAPIAIYNYAAYDIAKPLAEGEEYNSEDPPESMVVLSIGTDTTDLVVTNGFRVWQRNIPLGGNHFTKQLSKDLKLTFAKAEHLKRNPKQADDPKTIFQAMRPIFADMVTEVQRSIGFFQGLDRKAKIGGIVMLGNTAKLPGLTQYLAKHLGYPVKDVESFNKLSGANVVSSSSFKDNILSFATCYGLCLQGLERSKLSTNLLPREILTQRMIEAKKPWAVGGVSALVLGLALSYVAYFLPWHKVHPDVKVDGVPWKQAVEGAKQVNTYSTKYIGDDKKLTADLEVMKKIAQEVVGASDRRVLWMEVMKAINVSLPPMVPGMNPGDPPPDPTKVPLVKRQDLKIEYIESQYFPDLATWFTPQVKAKYLQLNPHLTGQGSAPGTAAPAAPAAAAPAPTANPMGATPMPSMPGAGSSAPAAPTVDVSGVQLAGPTGPGWVIEIKGHHYFNDESNRQTAGPAHVRATLLRNLEHGSVAVPAGPGMPAERFTMKELGIGFAILALDPPLNRFYKIPNPNYAPPANQQGGFGAAGSSGTAAAAAEEDPENPEFFKAPRYDFIVQFCWQEKPLNVRMEERRKAQEAAAQAAAQAPPATDQQAPAGTAPASAPAPAPGVPNPTAPAAVNPAAPGAAVPPAAAPGAAPPAEPAAAPPAAAPGAAPPAAVPAEPPAVPEAAAPAVAPAPVPPAVDEAGAGAAPPAAAPPAAAAPAPVVPAVPETP